MSDEATPGTGPLEHEHEQIAADIARGDRRAAAAGIELLLQALGASGRALASAVRDPDAEPTRIAHAAVEFQGVVRSTARIASQLVVRTSRSRLNGGTPGLDETEAEWLERLEAVADAIRTRVTVLQPAWEAGTTKAMRTERRPRLIRALAAFAMRDESSGPELACGRLDRDTTLVDLRPGRARLRYLRAGSTRTGLTLEIVAAFDPDDVRAHFTVTAVRVVRRKRAGRTATS